MELTAFGVLVVMAVIAWWTLSAPAARARPVRIRAADPLLEAARAEARRTVPRFRRLASEHPGRAMVKLRIDRSDGMYRGQWADVVSMDDEGVDAVLRGFGTPRRLNWTELEDWQVEVSGGRWRGAYSVLACWKIQERETGKVPEDALRQGHRFLDDSRA